MDSLPLSLLYGLLVAGRLAGIVLLLPSTSVRTISLRMRVVVVVLLACLVGPATASGAAQGLGELNAAQFVIRLLQEIAVGLLLGTGIQSLLLGVQVAGQLISQMAGISLSSIYSSGGESISALTRFLDLLATSFFFLVGGHRLVIGGLLQTFSDVPPGSAMMGMSALDALTTLLTHSFLLGIQSVLPILATLLVSNLLAGMLGRLMPQMNVLLLSGGLNALLLLAAAFVGIGALSYSLQGHLEPLIGKFVRLCSG